MGYRLTMRLTMVLASVRAVAGMKCLTSTFLAVAAAVGSGCARDAKPEESADGALERIERISYYDRNGDGKS